MLAFRRTLKYLPAGILGLLIVAWFAGLLGSLSVTHSRPSGSYLTFKSASATLGIVHLTSQPALAGLSMEESSGVRWHAAKEWPGVRQLAGAFQTQRYATCFGGFVTGVQVPLPVVATALLPLALGPFLSFRFRLWHYLAFTALIAVQLAFYLRWQE